jgi:hypothetical protein
MENREEIYENIMTDNLSELMRNPQTQEVQYISSR